MTENNLSNAPKRILVIEDNPEFCAVAKSVYDSSRGIQPIYASTFEEAMPYIKGEDRVDGVISDLFFPSQINWRQRFVSRSIIESVRVHRRFGSVSDISPLADKEFEQYERYLKDKKIEQYERYLNDKKFKQYAVGDRNPELFLKVRQLKKFLNDLKLAQENAEEFIILKENPSGLAIAFHCLERNLPYTIISQGNRHRGDLGTVRHRLQRADIFRQLFNTNDPLSEMAFRNVCDADKSSKYHWELALECLERRILYHIEHPEDTGWAGLHLLTELK